jgi:hypothetical protein
LTQDALWRKRLMLRRPHRLSNRQFAYCRQLGERRDKPAWGGGSPAGLAGDRASPCARGGAHEPQLYPSGRPRPPALPNSNRRETERIPGLCRASPILRAQPPVRRTHVSLCGKGNPLINIYAITSTGFDRAMLVARYRTVPLQLPVFEIEVREFILLPDTSTERAH